MNEICVDRKVNDGDGGRLEDSEKNLP